MKSVCPKLYKHGKLFSVQNMFDMISFCFKTNAEVCVYDDFLTY